MMLQRLSRRLSMPLASLAICLCYLGIVYRNACSAVVDDLFITLYAGQSLMQHGWFTNYNGEFQEMSSSPLASLIAGLFYLAAPSQVYLLNKCFSIICGGLALVLVLRGSKTFFPHGSIFIALAACVLAMLSPLYFYWASAGMEQSLMAPLFIAKLLSLLHLTKKPSARAASVWGVTLMLLLLLRAESFWLLPFSAVVLYALPNAALRRAIMAMAVATLFYALFMAVRYFGFGYLFPNPVYAKSTLLQAPFETLHTGLQYLAGYHFYSPMGMLRGVVLVYAFIRSAEFLWHLPKRIAPDAHILTCLLLSAYVFAILLSGGDWMPYHRLLMPAILLYNIVLLQLCLKHLPATRTPYRVAALSALCLATLSQPLTVSRSLAYENRFLSRDETYCRLPFSSLAELPASRWQEALFEDSPLYRRDKEMIEFVTEHFDSWIRTRDRMVITSYQAGLFPYLLKQTPFSDRVYFVDTSGLANLDLARLDVEKNYYGLKDGARSYYILKGSAGALSRALRAYSPDMLYMLYPVNGAFRRMYGRLGYELVWGMPSASILIKKTQK